MGLFKFVGEYLGVLSPAHIQLFTLSSGGKKIGSDVGGNKYYEAPARKGYKRTRRWVIYKNRPDASAVPPEWHGWLHHQTNTIPSVDDPSSRRPWQKPHQPNATGTTNAYRQPGHILQGGKRAKVTGDYKPWVPPK